MQLNIGDAMFIFHYLTHNPYAVEITDVQKDGMRVKLPDNGIKAKFIQGEPVVGALRSGDQVVIKGYDILGYYPESLELELIPDVLEAEANKRLHERMPVSHFAEIKPLIGVKRWDGVIKNISNYGLMLYTKAGMEPGEKSEVTVFLNDKMLSLEAQVVRKLEGGSSTKYGMTINANSYYFIRNAEQLFNFFKEEYSKKISKEFIIPMSQINLSYENLAFGVNDSRKLSDAALKLDNLLKKIK